MTEGCGAFSRCFPSCVPHLISRFHTCLDLPPLHSLYPQHTPAVSEQLGCYFQGREQAFLDQMSLERVKDVELLV